MDSFSYVDSDKGKEKSFKKFKPKGRSGANKKFRDNTPHKAMTGSVVNRFQEVVLGGLEKLFYKYGKFVAR
jgi:hypothetical protein